MSEPATACAQPASSGTSLEPSLPPLAQAPSDGGPAPADAAPQTIQVLSRALDIIEALAYARGGMALAPLARATGLSKSTCHRILQTLVERGYAERTLDGTYAVGHQMFDTLSRHIDSLELQTEAKPHMAALQRATNLTVYLGIRDGPFISIIERAATDRSDEVFTQVGRRYPAHCSSMGKCLMACLPSDELEKVLYGFDLEAFTPNTITDKAAFRLHLRKVRAQGWATDIEESALNHRCAAAPVFDYRGEAIAVVGVSGTNDELPDEGLDKIIGQVVLAGQRISAAIGYRA